MILILFLIWFVWTSLAIIRFMSLLGYKNHKDTLLDKILLPAVFPIAIILGIITLVSLVFTTENKK